MEDGEESDLGQIRNAEEEPQHEDGQDRQRDQSPAKQRPELAVPAEVPDALEGVRPRGAHDVSNRLQGHRGPDAGI